MGRSSGYLSMTYSKINLGLHGGLGDVVLNEKNVMLTDPCTDKIAATFHANQTDSWVCTHEYNTNKFRSYLVTEDGIDTSNYIISSVGELYDYVTDARGQLKFSITGSKLANASESGYFEIFNFDNATGIVSNQIKINDPDFYWTHGIEFSPNEQLIYVADRINNSLIQYDITLPSAFIYSSRYVLEAAESGFPQNGGQLQIGPDNKIYHVRKDKNYMGVIQNPNGIGTACNYDTSLAYSIPPSPWFSSALPNIIQTPNGIPNKALYGYQLDDCISGLTKLYYVSNSGFDSLQWNFNNPTTDTAYQITTTSDTIYFEYSAGGIYEVQCIAFFNGNADTLYYEAYIALLPQPDLGVDTTLCGSNSIEIDLSYLDSTCVNGNYNFLWQEIIDGDTSFTTGPIMTLNKTATYTLSIDLPWTCPDAYYDTVNVNLSLDTFQLEPDTIFETAPFSTTLDAGTGYQSYLWATGDTNQIITVSTFGDYWIEVANIDGCVFQDTIVIVEVASVDNTTFRKIKVYPNPTSNNIFITQALGCKLSIVNMVGDCVKSILINSNLSNVDISELKSGYYLIKIDGQEVAYENKLLIIK